MSASAAELAKLNAEFAERFAAIDPDDVEARQNAEKAFADEVRRRAAEAQQKLDECQPAL